MKKEETLTGRSVSGIDDLTDPNHRERLTDEREMSERDTDLREVE